ncbi:MAG: hypothetical protein IIT63_14145 [Prevotella sp.]|nr:hypothetical protein [Prevotella sp.]
MSKSRKSKEDRLVEMFRERVEAMSPEELETKLDLLDDSEWDKQLGVVSFETQIVGYNIIRPDMQLLAEHGINWGDTVEVILIRKNDK